MKRILLALIAVAALAACESSTDFPTTSPAASNMEEAVQPSEKVKPMLPAWQMESEKRTAKADQYSDHKDANPGIYGITQPPTVGVRPVAEYEDAQVMLLSYSSNQLPTAIKNNIADMAVEGQKVGDVIIIYDTETSKTNLSNIINNKGGTAASITWLDLGNDSIWMRDFGPVNIVADDGKAGLIDFRYYHQRVYDDAIPTLLSPDHINATVYRAPLYFEGGNFMSDTQGNCFASQGLLEHQAVSTATVYAYMKAYVGCDNLHIAKRLIGEGTTHIDMQSKIVSDTTIIVSEYVNGEGGNNVATVNDNTKYFESLGYTVLRFPFPKQGADVWRTYTNSLFYNGVNMWPVYSQDKDREAQALAVWQQAMPAWNHVAIVSDEIITWGGAMHCISQSVGSNTLAPIETPANACGGDWECDPAMTCTPDCTGKVCGENGCGGSCGSCAANEKCNLAAGTCAACVPNCDGKQCGDNGCDGSCGTCPSGQICSPLGECLDKPVITTCPGPNTPVFQDCGDYTEEGCCDDAGRLIYCYSGALYCIDCASASPSCGWDSENKWYDCGTQGNADPSGANPMFCEGSECTPDCAGKVCGSNGCGGNCGTCGAGTTCNATGTACEACQPNCTGKVCGNDGCGGTCGTCGAGTNCNATGTACVGFQMPTQCKGGSTPSGDDCGPFDGVGCCTEQGWVLYCDNDKLYCLDCGEAPECGWNSQNSFYDCQTDGSADPSGTYPLSCEGNVCTPNCAGKVCGDDGCGGTCGTCEAGATCTAGQCTAACVPSCEGKTCGSDGCDGTCGNCLEGEECSDGICKCAPVCDGRQCGPDNCGGQCGTCEAGQQCSDGQCVGEVCTPACTGKECGDDGCGGVCGTCGQDLACSAEGICEEAIDPDVCPEGTVWDGAKCVVTPGTKGNDGCTASPNGSPSATILLALALMALAAFRFMARSNLR